MEQALDVSLGAPLLECNKISPSRYERYGGGTRRQSTPFFCFTFSWFAHHDGEFFPEILGSFIGLAVGIPFLLQWA